MTLTSTILEGEGKLSHKPWDQDLITLADQLIDLEIGSGKRIILRKLVEIFKLSHELSYAVNPIIIWEGKNYVIIPQERIFVQTYKRKDFPNFKPKKAVNQLMQSDSFSNQNGSWTCAVTDGENWKIWKVSSRPQGGLKTGKKTNYIANPNDPEELLNYIQETLFGNPSGKRILRKNIPQKSQSRKDDPRRHKIICYADSQEQIFTDVMDLWDVSQEDRKKILNEDSTEQDKIDKVLYLVKIFRALNYKFDCKQSADEWFLKRDPLTNISPFEHLTSDQVQRFDGILQTLSSNDL